MGTFSEIFKFLPFVKFNINTEFSKVYPADFTRSWTLYLCVRNELISPTFQSFLLDLQGRYN